MSTSPPDVIIPDKPLSITEIRADITAMGALIDDELERTIVMIAKYDEQISVVDMMNSKLFMDMNACSHTNYKKKSQLQRIYFSYLEIVTGLTSTRMDYEKMRLSYIKERRGVNNDKVKNINSLVDTETNASVADTFRDVNKLFQVHKSYPGQNPEPGAQNAEETRGARLIRLANAQLADGEFLDATIIEQDKNTIKNGDK